MVLVYPPRVAINGKIPTSALTKLSTPGHLTAAAAASFERLIKDAKTTGTEHKSEAYRDLADQERLFLKNYQRTYVEYEPGKVDRRVWNGKAYYRKKGGVAAAIPGTSTHGLGVSVDFQNIGGYSSSTWKAFAAKAEPHGWNNIEGREVKEPWHWTYVEGNDQKKGEGGVELTDVITLTQWMSDKFDGKRKTMSVNDAMGYTATGIFDMTQNSDRMVRLLESIVAGQQEALAKQEEILEAIRALTVANVVVNVPDFDITLSGTAKKESS